MAYYNRIYTLCGCWYIRPHNHTKTYLPQIDLKSHTTILATTSRTKLTQTFHNPSVTEKLDEVQYTFPLYDGVSVVSFKCTVAGKTITGVVKEKQDAREDYKAAIDRGETAGLLEQIPEASDAFTTKIGNIPANEKVIVEIEYLGELKHDAETDGSRFTIPTTIAPRYGSSSANLATSANAQSGISISVDIAVDETSIIRGVQSSSHPIAVTMGRVSTTVDEDAFDNHHASATLTLGSTVLEKDFTITILAKDQDTPRALLETHPTIPDQRALMTTLVPKFSLPSSKPEIVFIVDRSGSMDGKIPTLVAALKVFLKSLPIAVKFNICSFGSKHKFMFSKSKTYDQTSLEEALGHVSKFAADFGGTEMHSAVEATFKNRLPGIPLEVLVLTDGQIWRQEALFEYIGTSCAKGSIRVFSLGIGSGASSSLVEGIARAGDGFAQFVDDNEKMDKRVVRMLKGALSPHINDYRLEVKFAKPTEDTDDDFEIIESVEGGIAKLLVNVQAPKSSLAKKAISLFDKSNKETPIDSKAGRFDHLPKMTPPAVLQTPHKVPTLYPFNRTTVYLLLGPNACQQTPSSVILRATSEHGPLELEIPVQDIGIGQTIHQLAAKKAVQELEEGRGWLSDATVKKRFAGTEHECRMDEMVQREVVRLGVEFQVGGKFCSFVAVENGVERARAPSPVVQRMAMKEITFDRGTRRRSGAAGGALASTFSNVQTFEAPSGPAQSLQRDRSAPGYAPPPPAPAPRSSEVSKKRQVKASGMSGEKSFFSFASSTSLRKAPQSVIQSFQSKRPSSERKEAEEEGEDEDEDEAYDNACIEGLSEKRESTQGKDIRGLSNEEKVRALIDLNKFDGSWTTSKRLETILGADWVAVKDWQRGGWSETARTTAIVIAFLQLKMARDEEIWEMVVEKANGWLTANTADAEEGIKEVKALLASTG